jgi:hypothetical protein
MRIYTSNYTHWAPSSRNLINYELIESELKVNWSELKLNQGLTRNELEVN